MIPIPNTKNSFINLFLLAALSITFGAHAQNLNETQWYFGNSSENLVFDANGRGAIVETNQITPFGEGGSAVILDQFTGNLLFYSDGAEVYDASNAVPPGSLGLNGNADLNIPVVTTPLPGEAGQYYLFTNSGTTGVSEIQVSILDANQIGNGSTTFPLGDVTSLNQPTGLTDPAEGMLVVPVGDGERFWLLTQNALTFDINVTLVDETGVNAPQIFNFVNDTLPGFEIAHMTFNRDSSMLAMAPKTANRNIWLVDFDVQSGTMVFNQSLLNTGFADGQGESIYDIEWSPNGSKLYFSRFGGTGTEGQVYQVDLMDSLLAVNPIFSNGLFRSYGLKRAIDDNIYHLYQQRDGDPFFVGRISRADSVVDSIFYEADPFMVDFNGRQFPSFVDGYLFEFDTLGFYHIDSCLNNVTKFFPIVDPVPNSLTWDLGEGFSDDWIPSFTYQTAGTYPVRLIAEVAGIRQEVIQEVTILDNDLMVDLGNDTTICVDEILTLDAGTGTSFVWSTGETTQTIEVDTLGTYWVEVTNATGCTDVDEILVVEYGVVEQWYNQWYFGERAGIEFTNGPLAILDANNMFSAEGCATISDVNGDLLFYTNGETVWNKEHEVMLNGDTIGGDQTSAQNAMILPFGDDNTMFYIFINEEVYGDGEYALKYAIVDMKKDEAKGMVVVKNAKLMENSTERVTASGFTGNDYMVVHEFGNNVFRSYLTGAGGLSGPIYSPVGEPHAFANEQSGTGYMKLSQDLSIMAVNIPGTSQVEILDFSEGIFSNPRLIDTNEDDLYGLEISSSVSKLYLTTTGTSSKLIQYDLDSLNTDDEVADIEATKYDEYPQGTDYGALQTAPNGFIYMAIDNSGSIGTIISPNGDDDQAGFNASGFDLQGRTSRLGLPNYIQEENTPTQTPSISISEGCVGVESIFSSRGRDPLNSIETYRWNFGDGSPYVFAQDTAHTYLNAGTYTVELLLSNRCDEDTILTTELVINNLPETPTLSDTTICDDPVILEAWPVDNPDFSYQWSTGDTTRQISVTDGAIITVNIVNRVTGCVSDPVEIFIADARPDINLGEDQVYCEGDVGPTLDSRVGIGTYEWAIDGVVLGTNRTFDVRTNLAGIFEYTVAVTNSVGCIGRDTVQVVVQESPGITTVASPTTDCSIDDGQLEINFTASGSFRYELSGTQGVGPFNTDSDGTVSQTLTGLAPGNYTLDVTNLVTGCLTSETIQIEDVNTFGLDASGVNGCLGDGAIDLAFASVPASFEAQYVSEDGLSTGGVTLNDPFVNPVFQGLDTGIYYITVRDNGGLGCIESDTVRLQLSLPQASFTFDAIQEVCGNVGEVLIQHGGEADIIYSWSGPESGTGDTLTISTPGVYTVTASGPNVCPRSEDIQVNFNDTPEVTLQQSGDVCEGEVVIIPVISGGSGNNIFLWNDGVQSERNRVTVTGDYFLTVTDQVSGCEAFSDTLSIEIQPELTVQLAQQPDCDEAGNVLLIATPNYSDPGFVYSWRGDTTAVNDIDSLATVNQSDEYTVTVTSSNGACEISDSLLVTIVPIDEEDLLLPESATYCSIDPNNPFVELNPGSWNTYTWRVAGDTTVLSTDPVYVVSERGNYEVELTNGFVCFVDEVLVLEDCRPVVFAPNAFSPNGNAQNEEFFVFTNDQIDAFEIMIYSRWGELLYRSNSLNFRWNGVYKGNLLPEGTYAYVMRFSSSLAPEVGTIEQYGSITLIR